MNTPDKNAVLIVEDHEIFRLGIRELINHEPDLEIGRAHV